MNPAGRAILHPAEYQPPPEEPNADYPLFLTTGRTVYHFHTRTKTARAPQLQEAAPDVWAEVSVEDAERYAIWEGDLVRLESRRGALEAKARVSGVRPGVVFVPFHYGYFDTPGGKEPDGRGRASNELTLLGWDPVSKQPYFKFAAVRLTKLAGGNGPAPAPANTASAPVGATKEG